jgi:hypothetical protein
MHVQLIGCDEDQATAASNVTGIDACGASNPPDDDQPPEDEPPPPPEPDPTPIIIPFPYIDPSGTVLRNVVSANLRLGAASANADQVHDEDEGLVRSDHPAGAALAVGEHRRDRDPPTTANPHSGHTLIPAGDDLALT